MFIDFKEILYKLGLFDEKCLNKSEFVYKFENGSWVEFFSTDSEQKLRGRKRDVLFVNEANELRAIEWQQLKLRTTRFSVIDYNPSFGDGHWINDVNADPRTKHVITTYKDNPFLEPEVVAEIESLRTKNKSLWTIYGLGLRAQVEGLVFPEIGVVENFPQTADLRAVWLGVDYGYTNDPTAVVRVGLSRDRGTIYIEEICYQTHMLIADILRVLRRFSGVKVISESADPRLVDEIHRAGVNIWPVRKFSGSINAGISKMRELEIKVTKASRNVLKEFANYVYSQDKEGTFLNTPVDCYNHAIDAVRYVVLSEILGGEKKAVDKGRTAAAVY